MYAIIEQNGKQYKVKEGDVIAVDLLDHPESQKLEIEKVLMVVDGEKTRIGTPIVKGVNISAEVLDDVKDDKVIAFKLRRRKKYRRKRGHRQAYTLLKIGKIEG